MTKSPFQIALDEYGTKEVYGKEDNPEVMKYFIDTGFDARFLKDETAWCSAFVNWCQMKAGLPFTKALNARSWLTYGVKVHTPIQGDIVVFWRDKPDSWKGHVAYYVTERGGWTYVLGGNQSNQVKIAAYPTSRVLDYRRYAST